MGQPKSNNNQNPLKNVAIIMDGNGRWAKNNKLKITKGHEKGVGVVKDIVEECVTQNINTLTIYAFSSENWSRLYSDGALQAAHWIKAKKKGLYSFEDFMKSSNSL